MGNLIPADIRIISQIGMKVDNSVLTGEPDILPRSEVCTNIENPIESKNLAFFRTICVEGRCKAIVLKTGDNTLIGNYKPLIKRLNI